MFVIFILNYYYYYYYYYYYQSWSYQYLAWLLAYYYFYFERTNILKTNILKTDIYVCTNPKIAWNDLKWCEAQSIWPCGSSFWLTSNQSTHAILGLVLWFQRVLQGFIGSKLQVKLKLSNCLIVFQIGVSTFLPRFHQVFYLDFIKFLPFYLDFKRSLTRFQQV